MSDTAPSTTIADVPVGAIFRYRRGDGSWSKPVLRLGDHEGDPIPARSKINGIHLAPYAFASLSDGRAYTVNLDYEAEVLPDYGSLWFFFTEAKELLGGLSERVR